MCGSLDPLFTFPHDEARCCTSTDQGFQYINRLPSFVLSPVKLAASS